jgi:hypothetical protein
MAESTEIAVAGVETGVLMEKLLVHGDLRQLTPHQRVQYYLKVCESLGLNPYTKPFEYIVLGGRLTLYATRNAADQLRKIHGISIRVVEEREWEGLYLVRVQAVDRAGRADEEVGVVNLAGLQGDARANAVMKALTKAKRRVTLSICGLGWLDETEVESVADAEPPRAGEAAYPTRNEPTEPGERSDASFSLADSGVPEAGQSGWTAEVVEDFLRRIDLADNAAKLFEVKQAITALTNRAGQPPAEFADRLRKAYDDARLELGRREWWVNLIENWRKKAADMQSLEEVEQLEKLFWAGWRERKLPGWVRQQIEAVFADARDRMEVKA